jgi:segregation and condensation protein B
MNTKEHLSLILEAILFSAGKPLTEKQLLELFSEEERPSLSEIRQALFDLQASYADRGVELLNIASGYQFQSKVDFGPWISRLWEEKPTKYSRALLETLALIAYRQPITRGEIEEIRGVSISTSIFKTLLEDRGWIRVVGHRDVPGRPGLYATTKLFLDYFGLNSLDQLALTDIEQIQELTAEDAASKQMEMSELTNEELVDEANKIDEEIQIEIENNVYTKELETENIEETEEEEIEQ